MWRPGRQALPCTKCHRERHGWEPLLNRTTCTALALQRYEGGDEPGGTSRPKETDEERERRKRMEEAKMLKAKKLKAFR